MGGIVASLLAGLRKDAITGCGTLKSGFDAVCLDVATSSDPET